MWAALGWSGSTGRIPEASKQCRRTLRHPALLPCLQYISILFLYVSITVWKVWHFVVLFLFYTWVCISSALLFCSRKWGPVYNDFLLIPFLSSLIDWYWWIAIVLEPGWDGDKKTWSGSLSVIEQAWLFTRNHQA